jgi:hypothetical protein
MVALVMFGPQFEKSQGLPLTNGCQMLPRDKMDLDVVIELLRQMILAPEK